MRAAGVEIAQGHKADAVRRTDPLEHLLHRQLGFAVGIGGFGGIAFENRHAAGLAVGRRGGREHDLVHAAVHHRVEQHLGAAEVVVIVFQRVGHALAHEREGRKVDHNVHLFRLKQLAKEVKIVDIALIELCLRVHRLHMARSQVVRDDHVVARFLQSIYRVRADVARAAQHQYLHNPNASLQEVPVFPLHLLLYDRKRFVSMEK